MDISYDGIRRLITPLRLIFWGGIFCVIDLTYSNTFNGEGWKFDLLDDAVGMAMILYGLSKLRAIQIDQKYASRLGYVFAVAIFVFLHAIYNHYIYDEPKFLAFVINILNIAKLIAIIVFCTAMVQLSIFMQLANAAKSWSLTRTIFVVIYLIPLTLVHLGSIIAMLTGATFNYSTNSAGGGAFFIFILVCLLLIPLIHLFVSTSRMINEAQAVPGDVPY